MKQGTLEKLKLYNTGDIKELTIPIHDEDWPGKYMHESFLYFKRSLSNQIDIL